MFTFGRDYFHDLARLGIDDDDAITDARAREKTKHAWQQLGRSFMASWDPDDPRELPWAWNEFGAP